MNHSTTTPRHPLLACADTIEKALASVVDCDPVYLDAGARADLMLRLPALISRVQALNLRVLAASGDVAAEAGCRTVADWVAPRTRTDKRAAYAQEKLAHALDQQWRHVAGALTDGRVHLDQARVIIKALDALPDDVTVEIRQRAERRLVEHAEQFGPADLARLGRRILDVIAPEVGDEQERRALERAEWKAESVTRLDFKRRGDGATDIAATVPDSVAARLKTYLGSFTSPRHQHGQGTDGTDPATGVRLPADRQRGHAFCALLERLDPKTLPDHGGLATTVMVTMPLEILQSDLGTAQLGTGETITPGEARRLACTAGLAPAVLGTTSEVLDLGRTAGLFSPAQRKALALQHPHCRAEDCTVPAPWTEAHHTTLWSEGGKTDLKDGLLLCHWHHKRAHDTRYRTERMPNGDLRYHRRR